MVDFVDTNITKDAYTEAHFRALYERYENIKAEKIIDIAAAQTKDLQDAYIDHTVLGQSQVLENILDVKDDIINNMQNELIQDISQKITREYTESYMEAHFHQQVEAEYRNCCNTLQLELDQLESELHSANSAMEDLKQAIQEEEAKVWAKRSKTFR